MYKNFTTNILNNTSQLDNENKNNNYSSYLVIATLSLILVLYSLVIPVSYWDQQEQLNWFIPCVTLCFLACIGGIVLMISRTQLECESIESSWLIRIYQYNTKVVPSLQAVLKRNEGEFSVYSLKLLLKSSYEYDVIKCANMNPKLFYKDQADLIKIQIQLYALKYFSEEKLFQIQNLIPVKTLEKIDEILFSSSIKKFTDFMSFLPKTVKNDLIYIEIPGEDGKKYDQKYLHSQLKDFFSHVRELQSNSLGDYKPNWDLKMTRSFNMMETNPKFSSFFFKTLAFQVGNEILSKSLQDEDCDEALLNWQCSPLEQNIQPLIQHCDGIKDMSTQALWDNLVDFSNTSRADGANFTNPSLSTNNTIGDQSKQQLQLDVDANLTNENDKMNIDDKIDKLDFKMDENDKNQSLVNLSDVKILNGEISDVPIESEIKEFNLDNTLNDSQIVNIGMGQTSLKSNDSSKSLAKSIAKSIKLNETEPQIVYKFSPADSDCKDNQILFLGKILPDRTVEDVRDLMRKMPQSSKTNTSSYYMTVSSMKRIEVNLKNEYHLKAYLDHLRFSFGESFTKITHLNKINATLHVSKLQNSFGLSDIPEDRNSVTITFEIFYHEIDWVCNLELYITCSLESNWSEIEEVIEDWTVEETRYKKQCQLKEKREWLTNPDRLKWIHCWMVAFLLCTGLLVLVLTMAGAQLFNQHLITPGKCLSQSPLSNEQFNWCTTNLRNHDIFSDEERQSFCIKNQDNSGVLSFCQTEFPKDQLNICQQKSPEEMESANDCHDWWGNLYKNESIEAEEQQRLCQKFQKVHGISKTCSQIPNMVQMVCINHSKNFLSNECQNYWKENAINVIYDKQQQFCSKFFSQSIVNDRCQSLFDVFQNICLLSSTELLPYSCMSFWKNNWSKFEPQQQQIFCYTHQNAYEVSEICQNLDSVQDILIDICIILEYNVENTKCAERWIEIQAYQSVETQNKFCSKQRQERTVADICWEIFSDSISLMHSWDWDDYCGLVQPKGYRCLLQPQSTDVFLDYGSMRQIGFWDQQDFNSKQIGITSNLTLEANYSLSMQGDEVEKHVEEQKPVSEFKLSPTSIILRTSDNSILTNRSDQTITIPYTPGVRYLHSGLGQVCVQDKVNTVCGGEYIQYQEINPDPAIDSPDSQFTTGLNNLCTVIGGSLECTGRNEFGINDVPLTLSVPGGCTLAAPGLYTACALNQYRYLVCWGNQPDAFLSDFVIPSELISTQIDHVEVSAFVACATLRFNFELICWGILSQYNFNIPDDLGPVQNFQVGVNLTCVLNADTSLYCFGSYGVFDQNQLRLVRYSTKFEHLCQIEDTTYNSYCLSFKQNEQISLPKDLLDVADGVDVIYMLNYNKEVRDLVSDEHVAKSPIELKQESNVEYQGSINKVKASVIDINIQDVICIFNIYQYQVKCSVDGKMVGMGADVNERIFCQTSDQFCYASIEDPFTVKCLGIVENYQLKNSYSKDGHIKQISCGVDRFCLLTENGEIDCYGGLNEFGENNIPAEVKQLVPKQIITLKNNTCWIQSNLISKCTNILIDPHTGNPETFDIFQNQMITD